MNEKDICEMNETFLTSYNFSKYKFAKEIIIKDSPDLFFINNTFKDLDICYLARKKSDDSIILLIGDDKLNEIKNSNDYYNIVDYKKAKSFITHFDVNQFVKATKNKNLLNLIDKCTHEKIQLPLSFFGKVLNTPTNVSNDQDNNKLIDFNNYYDFRFFANEIQPLITSNLDYDSLYDFAYLIGCFSPSEVQDSNTLSKVFLAQKATSLLSKFIKNKDITSELLDTINFSWKDYKTIPNKDFLNYISIKDNDVYSNFKNLIELSFKSNTNSSFYNNISFFESTIKNFDKIKSMRKAINENGMPYNRPWKDCIIDDFMKMNYKNIDEKNRDIAINFFEKGINQYNFNKVMTLLNKSRKNNMPHNILSKPLKEDSIIEQIKKLKLQNAEALKNGQTILEDSFNNKIKDLYKKQFTYELLDKYDPINAIIGVYCSCCAIISNAFYGHSIAQATITKNDVQNIVIRDKDNEIIAKGTMYVNFDKSYALINEFDINDKYKKDRFSDGLNKTENLSIQEMERQKIFETFIRAITDFVKEYDVEHPDNPLKQVNVGMGYNKLLYQCEQLEKSENLIYPKFYEFRDTEKEQRIIYKRPTNTNEKEK
jgi:hypothetical protein